MIIKPVAVFCAVALVMALAADLLIAVTVQITGGIGVFAQTPRALNIGMVAFYVLGWLAAFSLGWFIAQKMGLVPAL